MADNEAKIETIKKILDTNVGNSDAFPKTVVQNIWDTAKKGSIIQTLAGAIPLSLNGDAIPIPVGQATAGVVGEGETKPVTTMATKVKTVTPIKVATMILYSMETAQADPLGEYSRIQNFLGEAIARSVDMALIHGVDANTGTKITGKEALRDTTKAIEIDLAQEKAGYIGKQLTAGYDAVVLDVVDEHEFDFNHFLFAPKFRSSLVNALDGQGRPLYQGSTNLADQFTTVLGLPAAWHRSVSGYEKAKTGVEKLLGFGGDFKDNIRLGYVNQITYRRASERAGGIDLFDRNLGAILAEAQFGWVIRDTKAFVKYNSK